MSSSDFSIDSQYCERKKRRRRRLSSRKYLYTDDSATESESEHINRKTKSYFTRRPKHRRIRRDRDKYLIVATSDSESEKSIVLCSPESLQHIDSRFSSVEWNSESSNTGWEHSHDGRQHTPVDHEQTSKRDRLSVVHGIATVVSFSHNKCITNKSIVKDINCSSILQDRNNSNTTVPHISIRKFDPHNICIEKHVRYKARRVLIQWMLPYNGMVIFCTSADDRNYTVYLRILEEKGHKSPKKRTRIVKSHSMENVLQMPSKQILTDISRLYYINPNIFQIPDHNGSIHIDYNKPEFQILPSSNTSSQNNSKPCITQAPGIVSSEGTIPTMGVETIDVSHNSDSQSIRYFKFGKQSSYESVESSVHDDSDNQCWPNNDIIRKRRRIRKKLKDCPNYRKQIKGNRRWKHKDYGDSSHESQNVLYSTCSISTGDGDISSASMEYTCTSMVYRRRKVIAPHRQPRWVLPEEDESDSTSG